MIQAFIIMFREGFEAYLIVAIILAYLRKTHRQWLLAAVYWGIVLSMLASGIAGYILREGVNQSFWEGVLGIVAIVLVGSLIIHMWRTASKMKSEMEHELAEVSSRKTRLASFFGVLLFTILMISREGMETVILLIQVRQGRFVTGILLGTLAAAAISYAWARYSYLINIKRFFQVTGVFLLLFLVQVGVYSIHEFAEARILPNSEFIHTATEPYSPAGMYGKWFSLLIVAASALWLFCAWLLDRFKRTRPS